jgi:TP901 family phage tail tape measure protein
MADNTVRFTINVDGNAVTGVAQIDNALGGLLKNAGKTASFFDNFTNYAFKFNQITDAVRNFSDMLSGAIQPGVDFDHSLRELSAIAQVSGDPLEEIGRKARNLAKVFGGDAAQYVESFKDVIGSLGDGFSDGAALEMMGENVAALSKLMGGDAKAAANALTTAMLQYGVDLSDPVAASQEAARMMNIMQAAANVGASEVGDTAEALRQSGLLARQSGVGFEELNASLEVLAKGKIIGGEAGTAMRNMLIAMNTLTNMPKETAAALKAYGVDVEKVADPTVKFTDRLRELQKIQGDSVLMESVFMKANIASGSVILENIDTIDDWTEAVTGTEAATEGAATVMEGFQEKQARVAARFNDLKISIFNATGDLGLWTTAIAGAFIPLSQLMPLMAGLGGAMSFIKGLQFWQTLQLVNLYLAQGELVAAGFGTKMLQAALALTRFATVGIWNAVKGVGALMISLTTGGAASVKFAAISSGAFGAFATAAKVACKAVTVAVGSIPVIGWIAIAISGITAFGVWLYKKFDKFRALVNGIGAALKAVFTGDWGNIGKSFDNAYAETLRKAKEENEKADGESPEQQMADLQAELDKQTAGDDKKTELSLNKTLNGTSDKAAGDNKIKNININIDKVIDNFTVSTTTLKESAKQIRDIVAQAIIEGCNDVNLAF